MNRKKRVYIFFRSYFYVRKLGTVCTGHAQRRNMDQSNNQQLHTEQFKAENELLDYAQKLFIHDFIDYPPKLLSKELKTRIEKLFKEVFFDKN